MINGLIFLTGILLGSARVDLTEIKDRVQVVVAGDDELKGLVSSYIGRELRSLGNVVVVEKAPQYKLRLLVVKTENLDVVAVSVVVTGAVHHTIATVLPDLLRLSPEQSKRLKLLLARMAETTGIESINSHVLILCSRGELRQTCEEIVAEFDAENLERLRKIRRLMRDGADEKEIFEAIGIDGPDE